MTALLDTPVPVPHTADELVALVTRLAAEPARWRHLVRFDADQRAWVRLPSPDGVDVWLLTWLPGQSTELHDHGASTAAYTVVSGTVEETRVGPAGPRTASLARGQTRWLPPGAVHDVHGSGTGPAVTLHAYSPPLTTMTWYDDALRPVRTAHTSDPD